MKKITLTLFGAALVAGQAHGAVVLSGLVGYYNFVGGTLDNQAAAVGSTEVNLLGAGALQSLTAGSGTAVDTSSGVADFLNAPAAATNGGYLKLAVPYGQAVGATALGTNFSVSVWYRSDAPLGTARQMIMEGDGDFDLSYSINNGTAGLGQLFTGNSTTSTFSNATSGNNSLRPGWDNIIVTFQNNGTNTTITPYLNGVAGTAVTTNTTASISDTGIVFGTFRSENARFLDGQLDDIAIYNITLDQNQVNTIAVPEPSIALLGGLGVLGLLRRRRA